MTSVTATAGTGSKSRRKVVNVILLSGEELRIYVDAKGKLYEVFNQVAAHLSLRETEYFGLALLKDEEYQFLILDEKISKVAPKKWKTGSGEGCDSEGRPLLTLWFRVQFYVDQVVLLREKVTRHLYYLQLKENVLKYNHLYNEEKCFQIVGFALQADYGNFVVDRHSTDYVDPRLYFPAWMVEKRGLDYLRNNCPLVHQDLHNMTRTDAELKYVRECSTPPGAHNLHFYRVRKKKTDKVCNTWLAICARGVEIYEDDAGYKNLISTFLWPDIGRLVFDKKKFEIRSVGSAGGRRFAYYTESDGTSKYLLHICRSTHMFQMAIQPKLMEIRHLDAEDKKRYRESYIYSDARDFHANGGLVQCRSSKSPGRSPAATQRYSVISDVSSNTTSGIVSDKMAISFDDEEPGKEIIFDCPPRQTSVHGMPTQSHAKLPPRNSYKMTAPVPSSPSTAPPSQCLELFRCQGSGSKGSPGSPHLQELSPASSNGSYRAKLQQTSHSLYGSGGKTYTLPTPLSFVPGQTYSRASPSPSSPLEREFPAEGRSAGGRESFKGLQGALLASMERKVSVDSTTTSGSTASGGVATVSVESSPAVQHVTGGVQAVQYLPSSVAGSPSFSYCPASFTPPLPVPVMGGGLMYQVDAAPPSQGTSLMVPPMAQLGVPDSQTLPLHPLAASSHLAPLPLAEHLSADCSTTEATQDSTQELSGAPASLTSEMVSPFVSGEHGQGFLSQCVPSSGVVSSSSSYTQGGSIDSGHVLSDESSSAHHSAQSSEEDSGMKDSCSDSSASRKSTAGRHRTPGKVKAESKTKATHVSVKNQKEALHPDIEHILGQSQAQSLPLITALCNDLMTGSTHSSTGSYDTSTLRSSESRCDSRRWSTCGPMETSIGAESGTSSTGTMLVMGSSSGGGGSGGGGCGGRPYSWHSEHFDLDTTLNILPQQRKMAQQHSRPRPLLADPLRLPDSHRSVPQDLCTSSAARGRSVLWTQAISNSGSSAPYGGSLDRCSPQLLAGLIPSRLNSGGHSKTEAGNLNHHKALEENIGIA